MERRSITALLTLLAAAGCSQDMDDHQRAQSAAAWQAPTAWASGAPPHTRVTNGAPLNNAAGYPEQAKNTLPATGESVTPVVRERTAAGHFVSAPGRRVGGEVELQEVGTSVRAHLEVEGGQPGVRRIVFSARTDCATFARTAAGAPEVSRAGLGALSIEQDGRGEVTISVPDANLRADSDRSLMHGALLLYAAERMAGQAKRHEVPIACATIAST